MWIKEGKQAVKMTRLLAIGFRSNQVRLGAEPAGLQSGEFGGGGWRCLDESRTGR